MRGFAATATGASARSDDLIARIREARVGGTYWGAQPDLPPRYVLATSLAPDSVAEELADGLPVVRWDRGNECDPWHMLAGASAVVAELDDEILLVAAILEVPAYLGDGQRIPVDPVAEVIDNIAFENPFTAEPMTAVEAVELCAFWRQLIDANRGIAGGIGFAFWKQENVAPLLWGGSKPFAFLRTAAETSTGPVAVWRAKVSEEVLSELDRRDVPVIEVEDGFLRSQGLGADCVPPLSITVDRLGAYFDPRQPSELELFLQDGHFDPELLGRARTLRQLIVDAGLGKYERGSSAIERRDGHRRHILVPGQVEDDRAVQTGGCGLTSNLELLRKVREQAPDAYILYKPHPDVLAGHRRGAIADRTCLEQADEVVADVPISSLIAMVDEVHVNTSLAGFEALLRDKPVTTYGVPFYAGWGLTRDLGPVPSRRSARRTLDELVAATLLVYPRYLDPVSGLPCPAEVVVARLCDGAAAGTGLVVAMRRLQGKVMRGLRRFVR